MPFSFHKRTRRSISSDSGHSQDNKTETNSNLTMSRVVTTSRSNSQESDDVTEQRLTRNRHGNDAQTSEPTGDSERSPSETRHRTTISKTSDASQWNDCVSKDNGTSSPVKKTKKPLGILKKLSFRTAEDEEEEKRRKREENRVKFDKILMEVKVDSLPQVFVTKYLGYRACHGLWGIKHTRGPVEDMLKDVTNTEHPIVEGEDRLPLTQLRVSLHGIHVKVHSANKCTSPVRKVEEGLVPIEFISYGVQDVRYTRIFSFILVREMSSKTRKMECHAYVCESSVNCRRLSLSVAMAFQEYSQTLKGKPYKFQVQLQPSLEEEEEEEDVSGEDFEV